MTGYLIAGIAALGSILLLVLKSLFKTKKQVKDQKKEIKEIEKKEEKKYEAEKKAAEIKKTVNTGDDDSDFDNGLQQLHKYSQRKKVDQLVWATFPDPIGIVTRDKATNIVSMPYSYWKQIENYVIETEKNIEILTK